MRIKKMAMNGFKSFAEKAEIHFTDEIIAVVGPNGCGKSNIVDSIKWAMGEQSAKTLRGSSMNDVIFNGSADHPPLSMAEVSITFERGTHPFPPPYDANQEIMITRRLYRSGESEYQINGVTCRLKDITDLFLGTGSSPKAYSIIEQGKIDKIVMMKADERRNLIEEAAGISKYKQRKQSAQRKMEATESNLTRVDDILREVDRQAGYLRRQAKKAERYKEIAEQHRTADLRFHYARYMDLHGRFEAISQGMTGDQDRVTSVQGEHEKIEAELESCQLRILSLEEGMSQQGGRIQQVKDEIHRLERENEGLRSTIEGRREQIAVRHEEIEALRSKMSDRDLRLEAISGQEGDLRSNLENEHQALENRSKEFEDFLLSFSQAEAELTGLKQRLVEMQAELTRDHVAIQNAEERLQEVVPKCEQLDRLESDLRGSRDALNSKKLSREADVSSAEEAHRRVTEEIEQCESHLARLKAELPVLGESRLHLEGEAKATASKLEHVRSVLAEEERVLEGVAQEVGALAGSPVTSVLMDQVSVRSGFERIAEGLFGSITRAVSIETELSLGEVATKLLTVPTGGAQSASDATSALLAFNRVSNVAAQVAQDQAVDGIVFRPALTLFDSETDSIPPIVRRLLAHAFWTEALTSPTLSWESLSRLESQTGLSYVVVADEKGNWVDSRGLLWRAPATTEASGAGSLLSSRRLLEGLEERAGQIDHQREAIKAELKSVETEIRDREGRLSQLRHESLQTSTRKLELQKDIERLIGEAETLEARLAEVSAERTGSHQQRERLELICVETRARAQEAEQRKAAVEGDVYSLEETQTTARQERDRFQEEVTDRRIKVASLKERIEALGQERAHFETVKTEYFDTLQAFRQDIENWGKEIEQGQAKLTENDEAVARQVVELETLEKSYKESRDKHTQDKELVLELERRRRESQRVLDEISSQLGEQRLVERELEVRLQHLVTSVEEKYHLNLAEAQTESLPEFSDEERERFEVSNESRDALISELEAVAQDFRDKLDRLGEVNLLAISELEELEERHKFITGQREDLVTSLDRLRKVIDRINRITRQRFSATFDAINHNFQILFPKLFEGGKASLHLTDDSNLLETGVEIMVQPPGKKLQNLSLLSGGEKALTSVSLIFALFTYRPSSFCILDEVDAPLDDINTGRYNEIVRELAKLSQFILITHNKKTMEVADALYGVTMKGNGCTQLVSVRLKEAEKLVANV